MKDPIGQAIHDYYHFGKAETILVDSNYTEGEEMDPAVFFRATDVMPAIELKALDLCQGRVLDIGAGAGCHVLELQKRGFSVTAVEKSALAAEVMRLQGVKDVVCEDIFNVSNGNYNTILILMNGTGIAGTLEGLGKLLDHLHGLLAPGGQILLDSSDISYLFSEDDGSVWIDLSNKNYFGEMIYEVTYKTVRSDKFFWLFVDYDTLCEVATSHGYQCTVETEGENGNYLARLKLAEV